MTVWGTNSSGHDPDQTHPTSAEFLKDIGQEEDIHAAVEVVVFPHIPAPKHVADLL